MHERFLETVLSDDPAVRDRTLGDLARGLDAAALLAEAETLDRHRRREENLYRRVRTLFLLHAIHALLLPRSGGVPEAGRIPPEGLLDVLARRFEAGIDRMLAALDRDGPSLALSSALALGYRSLGLDALLAQVRRSVRESPGNRWMFEVRAPTETPLRLIDELAHGGRELVERTPVRMDLTHCAWSDIFFLAMDRPEWARVLNVSIDLAVAGRDGEPAPPVEARVGAIPRPRLELRSLDLGEETALERIEEVFDFAADHLGLLRAAAVASGLVPPALEEAGGPLAPLLERVAGPGKGIRLTTCVRGIPRGSRLAVSTTLLAAAIAASMRATGQIGPPEGPIDDEARRLVAGRAILGEWLGGSGGGWQDSGGLWPGIKLIVGREARPGDPEYGQSRGRLLPDHVLLGPERVPPAARRALAEGLVLAHGGMSQDVGPILRLVTERYLLRSEPEWSARGRALALLDDVLSALEHGDLAALGAATHENFFGPIRTILPWTSNAYTEEVVEGIRRRMGGRFLGFWMLGGMAGGGMGFLFRPEARDEGRAVVLDELERAQARFADALPFAIAPLVYDFRIDEIGTRAALEPAGEPPRPPVRFEEPVRPEPWAGSPSRSGGGSLDALLERWGFDPLEHERLRRDLLAGRIGLAENRLPNETPIEDVDPGEIPGFEDSGRIEVQQAEEALRSGEVAMVVLAGGAGSRWSGGARVVKAIAPFCPIDGRFRSFLEIHARTARAARRRGAGYPLVVTTSPFTHEAIAREAAATDGFGLGDDLVLSAGRHLGRRMVPTERDLRFSFADAARQVEDERSERLRASLLEALVRWARTQGEASDYADRDPLRCVHPPGHFFEVPNLLVNGQLARLLERSPGLRTLLVCNVDTLGAAPDARALAAHRSSGAAFTFEVVARHAEDRGGGLARIEGRTVLVEGPALPRDDDELRLRHYNTLTTWVDVDGLLDLLGLERGDLADAARVREAVSRLAHRLPVYVTLKEVRRSFGAGHEDRLPVVQCERLWGDVTRLPEARCSFLRVPRVRGRQLKDPESLDLWWRDGSFDHVVALGGETA